MLKTLDVTNLTVFSGKHTLELCSGVNVLVGENGAGKTHLLKAIYSMIATSAEAGRNPDAAEPSKAYLQKAYADKLVGVFRPDALGRLASRKQGRERCEIALGFTDKKLNVTVNFATNAQSDVQIAQLPKSWETDTALYMPSRELMSIYPGLATLYDTHFVPFEETWRDTCMHLGVPPLKGKRSAETDALMKPLEQALGGRVVLEDTGRFYLQVPGSGKMEMHLVAEGLCKLAMLAQLIGNGRLQQQSYLFWDEPEANLNPQLIRLAARVIHALASHDVQIFIATHSYFLLKELELLADENGGQQQVLSLCRQQGVVESVETADRMDDLEHWITLEEELDQYERELGMSHA